MDPLNRTSAPKIIRLFDVCFKQGVIDAEKFSDDYGAREFLAKHKSAWGFGILGDEDDYDWEMWRFTLYRWAKRHNLRKFAETYIYKITRKNYLWYLLPFCMRFYLLGISEWLEYPQPIALERFKHEPRIHWAPQQTKSMNALTRSDFISYMHEFTYEFRRECNSCEEKREIMSPLTMDGFCQAVHALTSKYDTGKRVKVEEEDI